MPRFGFTVRRLMIVVAFVAFALGLYSRRTRLLGVSRQHRHAAYTNVKAGHFEFNKRTFQWGPSATYRWHLEMERIYKRAADHPWLPVPKTPPQPE